MKRSKGIARVGWTFMHWSTQIRRASKLEYSYWPGSGAIEVLLTGVLSLWETDGMFSIFGEMSDEWTTFRSLDCLSQRWFRKLSRVYRKQIWYFLELPVMIQRISTLRTTFCRALPTNIFAGISTAVPTGPCVIWKCCWLDGRGEKETREILRKLKRSESIKQCIWLTSGKA